MVCCMWTVSQYASRVEGVVLQNCQAIIPIPVPQGKKTQLASIAKISRRARESLPSRHLALEQR